MWGDRLKLGLVLVVVGLVLVVAASGGFVGGALGWLLCVYVLVRAAPAIRSDVRRVRLRLVPERQWRF